MIKKRDMQGFSLRRTVNQFKKNKSAFGGFSWFAKLVITILAASLFIWLIMKMIGSF